MEKNKDQVECTGWVKYYTVRCNLEEYDVVETYDANVEFTSYEVRGVEDAELRNLIWRKIKEWDEEQ